MSPLDKKFSELVGAYNMLPEITTENAGMQPLKVFLDMQQEVIKQILVVMNLMKNELAKNDKVT